MLWFIIFDNIKNIISIYVSLQDTAVMSDTKRMDIVWRLLIWIGYRIIAVEILG